MYWYYYHVMATSIGQYISGITTKMFPSSEFNCTNTNCLHYVAYACISKNILRFWKREALAKSIIYWQRLKEWCSPDAWCHCLSNIINSDVFIYKFTWFFQYGCELWLISVFSSVIHYVATLVFSFLCASSNMLTFFPDQLGILCLKPKNEALWWFLWIQSPYHAYL